MKPYEPIREIKFAAKSGFLTKELWNEFFARGSVGWRNKQWVSLTKDKLFIPHYAKLASSVLVLNRKSKLVQKTVGDDLVLAPFISQLDHDEKLARLVLGLLRDGVVNNYRLEPELKRLNPNFKSHYGSEQKDKYPDALVQLADDQKTRIAVELELTKKDPKRYRRIMESYSSFRKADMVVFIVRDDRISQTIRQAMRESYYPVAERPVGFGRLDEWVKNPSTAKISFADRATTLFEIANKTEKMVG